MHLTLAKVHLNPDLIDVTLPLGSNIQHLWRAHASSLNHYLPKGILVAFVSMMSQDSHRPQCRCPTFFPSQCSGYRSLIAEECRVRNQIAARKRAWEGTGRRLCVIGKTMVLGALGHMAWNSYYIPLSTGSVRPGRSNHSDGMRVTCRPQGKGQLRTAPSHVRRSRSRRGCSK